MVCDLLSFTTSKTQNAAQHCVPLARLTGPVAGRVSGESEKRRFTVAKTYQINFFHNVSSGGTLGVFGCDDPILLDQVSRAVLTRLRL